jgi:hypothetical protein
MPCSRRGENFELIKLSSSDDGDKHSVWHYRIVNPVPIGPNRVSLYDSRGLYNIWGYTEVPTEHIIGLIEFKAPVDIQEAEAMLRHQYSGSYLMEPLQSLSVVSKVMKSIKDVYRTNGTWVETHVDTDQEDLDDLEDDDPDFDDDYANIDDDDRGGGDPAEEHAAFAARPVEERYDPVEAIADIGERIFAHI